MYEDWQDLVSADFPHTHTPVAKTVEKAITQKVPSAAEAEEPLKKLLAMEKLFKNCSLEDFVKTDGSLNELGQLWQELFKLINQSLK